MIIYRGYWATDFMFKVKVLKKKMGICGLQSSLKYFDDYNLKSTKTMITIFW